MFEVTLREFWRIPWILQPAWFAEITEATEDPINGIAAWLTSYGWVVEEIDMRK